MQVVTSVGEMGAAARALRGEGRKVGLVPTMGALHEGHLSLVRRARAGCGAVVVTIFVNPTQFGPSEDYARYPRDLDRDLASLRPFAVDLVFAPAAAELYPPGFETYVEPGAVARPLEGAARPGHFRGVATVVLKLLNLVRPEAAYFGQKDFQQVAVIRRMAADLDAGVRIVMCPTVREQDGLALSSRNAYLGPEHRRAAAALYRGLRRARGLFQAGEPRAAALIEAMRAEIEAEPLVEPDYTAVVSPASMQAVEPARGGCVALVAARVGPARLIDNVILGPAGASEEDLIDLSANYQPAQPA